MAIYASTHHLIVRVEIMTFVWVIKTLATICACEVGFPFLLGVERITVKLVLDTAPWAEVIGVELLEPGFLTADT